MGRVLPGPQVRHRANRAQRGRAPSSAFACARPRAVVRQGALARRLTCLGISPRSAGRRARGGRKFSWTPTRDLAVDRGLRNACFVNPGLVSLRNPGWLSELASQTRPSLRWIGSSRDCLLTGGGCHNLPSRRAGCEQHESRSLEVAQSNLGAYPIAATPATVIRGLEPWRRLPESLSSVHEAEQYSPGFLQPRSWRCSCGPPRPVLPSVGRQFPTRLIIGYTTDVR